MFTINGTLQLAKNTAFFHHMFQLKPQYLIDRIIREEKEFVICEASNTTTNRNVTIIKFSDIFRNNYGLPVLRQVQIHKAMKHCRHIRQLVDLMIPSKLMEPGAGGGGEEEVINFTDVYMVFNSMVDFDYLFAEKEEEEVEQEKEVNSKSYLLQLLNALLHLHMAGIVHGNLRPRNLVVSSDKKIIQLFNFNLSAPQVAMGEFHEEEEEFHPTLMGYLPPEFMLGFTKYETSADIWAVGCLFAQLLNNGKPFFLVPPEIEEWSRKEYFLQVIKVSRPTPQDFEFLTSEADKHILLQLLEEVEGKQHQHPIDDLTDNEVSRNLLKGFLHFDPNKRLTVEEALKYFAQEESLVLDELDDDDDDDDDEVEGGLENRMNALSAAYNLKAEGIAHYNMSEGQIKSLIWKEMKSF